MKQSVTGTVQAGVFTLKGNQMGMKKGSSKPCNGYCEQRCLHEGPMSYCKEETTNEFKGNKTITLIKNKQKPGKSNWNSGNFDTRRKFVSNMCNIHQI